MLRSKRKRYSQRLRVTLGVTLALTVALVVLTVPSVEQAAANFLKDTFTHRPEPLTELYFTDPAKLPTSYTSQQSVKVSFTIHNLEHTDTWYRYSVHVKGSEEKSKNLLVKAGDYTAVTAEVKLGGTGRQQVTVELLDQKESIHFWLEPSDE